MKPKECIKRTKLSESQLKSEILALFNSGNTGKTDLFGIIRIKYTLARDRYFKMYDQCYAEWTILKEKADTEATVEAANLSAKTGLKTKIEKQLSLQNQIDEIQAEIDLGYWEQVLTVRKKEKIVKYTLSPQEKGFLRKTMRELYAELNKMEGDYAPTKVAQTDNDGNNISPNITINQFMGESLHIREDEK